VEAFESLHDRESAEPRDFGTRPTALDWIEWRRVLLLGLGGQGLEKSAGGLAQSPNPGPQNGEDKNGRSKAATAQLTARFPHGAKLQIERRNGPFMKTSFEAFHSFDQRRTLSDIHGDSPPGPKQQGEAQGCPGTREKKQRIRATGRAHLPKCIQASGMITNCRTRGPTDAWRGPTRARFTPALLKRIETQSPGSSQAEQPAASRLW
jgi:hypothetical protein